MNNKLDLNNNISTEVNNPYLNATKTIQDNQYKTSLDTVIKQVKKYKLLFWIFLITTILYTVFVVYINYIANFYDIQYNKYAESLNKNDHYKTINTTNENSYTSEIMLLGNTIYYKINDSYIEDLNTYELIKYLNDGYDVILEIDINGYRQIKENYPDVIGVFITLDDLDKLEERLRNRGTETEEQIKDRMNRAREEIKDKEEYPYVLINYEGKANETMEKVYNILKGV